MSRDTRSRFRDYGLAQLYTTHMSSARIRAPRGTLALRAGIQSRKLWVELELAQYNEWIEGQRDSNGAALATQAPSHGISSAPTSAPSGSVQFESLSLQDWLTEGRWRAIHVIPKARMALLVESKRGYSGLATDEHLDCFDDYVQPHSLTDLPIALLEGEVEESPSEQPQPSAPLDVIEPPPRHAGFALPVVSPRPGPLLSADCCAA